MRVGALALLGMLTLSGCGGGTPIPTLPPTPTATPVFASEEEALAAAEEAYAAYLAMSNRISSEGGIAPERIEPFADRDLLDASLDGFQTLRDNQWRVNGLSVVIATMLQSADLSGQVLEGAVAAYVCVDVSAVDVLDADGESVVSPERPDVQAFEVFFDLKPDATLIPATREPWDPESVCGAG